MQPLGRKASYKTIFGERHDLLSLNAFSEVVANDDKYKVNSAELLTIRRIEEGSCTSAMLLQQKESQRIAEIPESVQSTESPLEPTANCNQQAEQAQLMSPSTSLHPPEQSLQFAYKEEHSELSTHGPTMDEVLRRIEESSIDLRESSDWEEQAPRNDEVHDVPLRSTQINAQRRRIEDEKLRIERERSQLDRKRTEIEAMLKEYYQLRECSNKDSDTTVHRSQITLHNTSLEKTTEQIFATPITEHTESRPTPTVKRFQSARQPSTGRNVQPHESQSTKESVKQKKARQALLLETLWINLIRHHNEARIRSEQLLVGAMRTLKQHWKVSKIVAAISGIVYSANFQ